MVNQIFALMGPHAAGKAAMISQLISMGVNYIPTYTTKIYTGRDKHKRALYHTLKKEEFAALDCIVKVSYQGNYFGIKKTDLLGSLEKKKISVIVLTSDGVKQLNKFIKQNLITVYLMVDYVALVDRMLRLGYANEEIKYYLEYAESNKEFDLWKSSTHVVKNVGAPNIALNQLLSLMGLTTLLPPNEFKAKIK